MAIDSKLNLSNKYFSQATGQTLTLNGNTTINGSLNINNANNTEIIFNNGGTLSGNTAFTFSGATQSLSHGNRRGGVYSEGQNSVVLAGDSSYATGLRSIAIGRYAYANGQDTLIHGRYGQSDAGSCFSVAMGVGFLTNACYSFAAAGGSVNNAEYGSAIGRAGGAHANNAIGLNGNACGVYSVSIGNFSCANGNCSIAIVAGDSNNRSAVNGDRSVLIGGIANIIQSGNTGTTLIGGVNVTLSGTSYSNVTALGGNISIYNTPSTGSSGDTVLVRDSSTGIIRQVPQSNLGGEASVNSNDTEIIFNNNGSLSGNTGFTFSGVTQSLTHGNRAPAFSAGTNSVVLAGSYSIANSENSVSIGAGAYAYARNSVALGGYTRAYANGSVAILAGSAIGDYSLSINSGFAKGCQSTNIGNSTTCGCQSITIGRGNISFCDRSITIGNDLSAQAGFSSLFGGQNNIIESGNTISTLIGGTNITLTGTSYIGGTVLGGNIAIYNQPSAGTSGDTVLVRDSSTGIIKVVAQTSVGSSLTFNNGLTDNNGTVSLGGTLTGNTIINTAGNSFRVGTLAGSYSGLSTSSGIQLGSNSAISGSNSISLGYYNKAFGDGTVSLGTFNRADGGYSISVGSSNYTYNGGIGIGSNTLVYGAGNFAFGRGRIWSTAGGSNIVVGSSSNNNICGGGGSSIIGGDSNKIFTGQGRSSIIGGRNNCLAQGSTSFQFGYTCNILLGGINVVVGSGNTCNTIIGGFSNTISNNTYTGSTVILGNIAIYNQPQVGTSGDTVLVRDSSTGIIRQINQSGLTGGGSSSLTFNNGLINQGDVVSLGGTLTGNTQINMNGSSFKMGEIGLYPSSGNSSFAAGCFSSASGINAIALGRATRAEGSNSVALGYYAYSYGNTSVSLGYGISRSDNSFTANQGRTYTYNNAVGQAALNRGRAFGTCSFAINNGSSCGENSFAMGISTTSFGSGSFAGGSDSSACNASSFAFGNFVNSSGSTSISIGKGVSTKQLLSGGNFSKNISNNDNNQVSGHGALAEYSTIIGGINHNIEVNNTNATIIGGNAIKLTGTTYIDTTAVSNLAIMSTPVSGDASTTVMVRNAATGIIQERAQADVASASDSRLKNLLQPISGVLDGISRLNAYEYEFNDLIKPESLKGKTRYGLIAQELEEVFPHVVEDDYSIGDETYKSVRYTELIPILVKAIQELKSEIDSLKNK